MDRKQVIPIEVKFPDDEPGTFVATFSRLNVIDKDGDVTVPGAFKDGQAVKVAQWGHNWGALPVGKGVINSDDEKAWVSGQFFLDTVAGRETYTVVKNLAELQEWSYGFEVTEESFGEFQDQRVRFLRGLDVFEVSPVMVGAGIGTRTETIKGLDSETIAAGLTSGRIFVFLDGEPVATDGVPEPVDDDADEKNEDDDILTKHGRPLQDHREAVLEAVPDLVSRYEALAASEAKEGRTVSEARRQQMADVAGVLEESATSLRTILTDTELKQDDDDQDKLARIQESRRQHALFMAHEAGIDMTGEHDEQAR